MTPVNTNGSIRYRGWRLLNAGPRRLLQCYDPTDNKIGALHHFQLVQGREGLNDVSCPRCLANAPQRVVQGLRWFSNAGQLGWVLHEWPTRSVPADGRALGEPDPQNVAHGRRSLVGLAWLLLHWVRSAALPPHPARQALQDHGVDDARLLPEDPVGGLLVRHFHPPSPVVGIGRRVVGSVPVTAPRQAVYLRGSRGDCMNSVVQPTLCERTPVENPFVQEAIWLKGQR